MNQHIKHLIIVGLVSAAISGTGFFFLGESMAIPGFTPGEMVVGPDARGGLGQRTSDQMGNAKQQGTGKRGAGMIAGEIVRIDDETITVKVGTEGTRLILLSDTTTVNACGLSTASALEVGKQIMVNGMTGDDGSVTAKTIQIIDRDSIPTAPPTDKNTQL